MSQAQPYYFEHYTAENGLSNTTTTCVLQDKKGFLWIGTLDGLNRFDGYNFKIYRNVLGDSTSLGCNAIWRMFQCHNGTIWLVTDCGVYLFNPLTEIFFKPKGLPKGFINGMAEDKNNVMWVEIEGKLYQYNPKTCVAKLIENNDVNYFTACLVTNNNELIVGTRDGKIGLFNPTTNRFSFYSVFDDEATTTDRHYIFSLFDNGNATLLIGTMHKGVKLFSLKDYKYKNIFTKDSKGGDVSVKDFCRISSSKVWIATESGIFIYDEASSQYINVQKIERDPYGLSDNVVFTICKDKEGGIWAATFFGGLNFYSPTRSLFEKYVSNISDSSLHGTGIGQIIADNKDNLWVGSGNAGINKYDIITKRFTHFTATGKNTTISYNNIQGILCDSNELYIGTYEHGMDIMNLKNEKIIYHYSAGNDLHQLRDYSVRYIYKTTDNKLLMYIPTAIYTYNKKQRTFTLIDAFPKNVMYTSILETKDGTIWATSYLSGVFYYNPKKGVAGKLHILFNGKDLFENNNTLYLKEAKDGTLWVTSTNGLFHIDLKDFRAKIYSIKDGLPSNIVCSIVEDDSGRLWIPTTQGLAVMEKDLKTIKVFHKSNGLLDDEFSYASAYQAKDGRIYLGSLKGMISFDPSTFKPDNYEPDIYITNFSVFNIPLKVNPKNGPLYHPILQTDHITLKYKQSPFSIDFTAISYTSPENIQYAYKMENFDNKWIHIKSNRSVNFTGLPPGDYLFKIRSTNSSGVWQNNERALRITILPPFWKTIWAYLLYIFLLLLAVYLIARGYKKYLLRKQKRQMELYEVQKEKELYAAKTDFFTKVAHEIRTPLTLIKAPMERVISETRAMPDVQDYLSIMNKNTQRLLHLTNELLDLNKIETAHFALNMSDINLKDLLEDIYYSFRSTMESKGIEVEYYIDDSISTIEGDRNALMKIISNLLDNAIKYCQQKIWIKLQVANVPNMIELVVSNDGIIIPSELNNKIFEPFFRLKATERITGTGIGLAMARSLAELHKGNLYYNSKDGLNNFILCIPANND